MNVKRCIDCRFSIGTGEYMKCGSDGTGEVLEGKPVPNQLGSMYCETNRIYGWLHARLLGVCGREGRFFQPKS
jgi:hypothetical protein